MNPHVSGTTLGVGLDQRPGGKGTRVAGNFGLDPHRLDDEALERELRYGYATREETFFRGTCQALPNHTDHMLQLEHGRQPVPRADQGQRAADPQGLSAPLARRFSAVRFPPAGQVAHRRQAPASAAASTTSAGTVPAWTASTAPGSVRPGRVRHQPGQTPAGCWGPSPARRHEHPSTRSSDHNHSMPEHRSPRRSACFSSMQETRATR